MKAIDVLIAAGFTVDSNPGYDPLITLDVVGKDRGTLVVAAPDGEGIDPDATIYDRICIQHYPEDDWTEADADRVEVLGGEDGLPVVQLLMLAAARFPAITELVPLTVV